MYTLIPCFALSLLVSCGGGSGGTVVSPISETGSIRVTVNVNGGAIVLDGQSTGTTISASLSATLTGVTAGTHTVTIQQTGYATPSAQSVTVVNNQTASVSFTLIPSGNNVPMADAGTDTTVFAGYHYTYGGLDESNKPIYTQSANTATLDGSSSNDADGHTLSYQWEQTAGPSVTLSSTTSVQPEFTPSQAGTYTFSLTVSDGYEVSDPDTVNVTVVKVSGKLTVSLSDTEKEVWTMNADGSELTQITNNSIHDEGTKWGPDGSEIVFHQIDYVSGTSDIFIINTDGTNQRQLTNRTGRDSMPDVSPDGSTIVFSSNRYSAYEILSMDINGDNIQRLTNSTYSDALPEFSPDGTKILFNRQYSYDNFEVMVMDTDGGNVFRLTDNSTAEAYATWMPDGRIVYTSSNTAGSDVEHIYSVNSDGSNLQEIPFTSDVKKAYCLSVSSDGNFLFIGDKEGEAKYLKIMTIDGSAILNYGIYAKWVDYHPGS